ncbi:NfeD family protein [Desulfotalea psychrophila]|nr:NfeD family protein [Desulfotalea psychrophila]
MTLSYSLIWFLVGVLFLIVELLLPGFILIFFTAGCWIAGLTAWLTDIGLPTQILIFIISSLLFLFSLRRYCLKTFKGSTRDDHEDPYINSKIGKTALVTKEISANTPGEIKVMGSFWRAVADESIEEGQSVLVTSQESEDGLTFRVKKL